jgi:hypothetical protein
MFSSGGTCHHGGEADDVHVEGLQEVPGVLHLRDLHATASGSTRRKRVRIMVNPGSSMAAPYSIGIAAPRARAPGCPIGRRALPLRSPATA